MGITIRIELCLFSAALFCLLPSIASADVQVEEEVREFFADTPVMIEIARCESKFRQYNADGTPLRGGWSGGMVGVFQFFESVHAPGASALGFDLTTLEGNLGYAKHVYTQSGTTPWNSAKACWESAADTPKKTELSDNEITQLQARIKELTKIVMLLQELLEKRRAA